MPKQPKMNMVQILHWEKNAIESIEFLTKAGILFIQKNMPMKLIHMLPIL